MESFYLNNAEISIVPNEPVTRLSDFDFDAPVAKLAKLNKRALGVGFRLVKVKVTSDETQNLNTSGFRVGRKHVYSSVSLFPVSMLQRADNDCCSTKRLVLPGYYVFNGSDLPHACVIVADNVKLPLSEDESVEDKLCHIQEL